MSKKRGRAARIFMFVTGIILVLAGLLILYADRHDFKNTVINNLPSFLTGVILIYLGRTYKKKDQ